MKLLKVIEYTIFVLLEGIAIRQQIQERHFFAFKKEWTYCNVIFAQNFVTRILLVGK